MTAPVNTVGCKECGKPVVNKSLQLCMSHYQAWRRAQVKEGKPTNLRDAPKKSGKLEFVIPPEIVENMNKARTTEDWQNLATAIAPIMAGIMAGNISASAAQVSLIKNVMDRAYGKPVATQADKQISNGVVLLPTLNTGKDTLTCPQCTFNAIELLQDDSTKELAKRILKELLERLIAAK